MALLICTIGCNAQSNNTIIPHNNQGGYTLNLSHNSISDSVKVMGSFFDVDTKEILVGSTVKFYCELVKVDSNGNYNFKLSSKLATEYFFEGISLGYKTVMTKSIEIKSDLIKLDFFLEKDNTPIYHCED